MSRTPVLRHAAACLAFCAAVTIPVRAPGQSAQDTRTIEERQVEQAARTETTVAGEVGQRQTREDILTDVAPMARINSRVQNRVQNRIRNRIDRFYDPQANATSPFAVASEEARAAARRVQPR